MSSQQKWDKIYSRSDHSTPKPSAVLQENSHLLPKAGTAIELACGLGGNALFLASHGLQTSAWDISPIAIVKLQREAEQLNLPLHAEQKDLTQPLSNTENRFDVVVVSRYLDRSFCRQIEQILKPDGLLFYQTFCIDKVSPEGPSNPDYLLQKNELLRLFATLDIVVYREEGVIGDTSRGFRNQAMLVARKERTSAK